MNPPSAACPTVDRILVVDDLPRQLRELVTAVDELGFSEIRTATTESEAYERIAAEKFSVAVVDIMLDGRDREGLRIMKRLQQKQPDCRIIALTAKDDGQEMAKAAIKAGAHDFICADWEYINWRTLLRYRLSMWRGVAEG